MRGKRRKEAPFRHTQMIKLPSYKNIPSVMLVHDEDENSYRAEFRKI